MTTLDLNPTVNLTENSKKWCSDRILLGAENGIRILLAIPNMGQKQPLGLQRGVLGEPR
jgi:hypothetical protein